MVFRRLLRRRARRRIVLLGALAAATAYRNRRITQNEQRAGQGQRPA